MKRTRPRQPLNGVIIAIAMTDIAAASPPERLAHARAIRRRIKELSDQLGVRMPVYAIFTKADLLAGFMEFFDDLDREKRGAVWGTTFPLNKTDGGSSAAFATEFDLLVERLNQRLIDRLQAERSPERRVAIAGFPAQVGSLKQPLTEFVQEAFGGTRLDPAPFLRGIYFASGTQEGTPIDRLTGALARGFGIDQQRAPSLRPEAGKSYFLTRLLKDVIFGEAMLVSRDPAAVKRGWMLRLGAAGLAGLVALVGAAALIQTRSVNSSAIAQENAAVAAYVAAVKALPLDPVNDADLAKVAPVLDMARNLPFGAQVPATQTQWFPGLSQTGKLGAGAGQIYTNALDNILLPRLMWRLEGQMRSRITDAPFLYEATRTYLMLGSAGPLDRAWIKAWMKLDWLPCSRGRWARRCATASPPIWMRCWINRCRTSTLDGALVDDARRHFLPRFAGGPSLPGDPQLTRSGSVAAMGASRCRRSIRFVGVHPPLRRPPERWFAGVVHGRWVLQSCAADAAEERWPRSLATVGCWGNSRSSVSRVLRQRPCNRMWSSFIPPNMRRTGMRSWPTSTCRR